LPRISFALAAVWVDIVVFLGAGKYNLDAPEAFAASKRGSLAGTAFLRATRLGRLGG